MRKWEWPPHRDIGGSGLERPVEERQTPVHAVVDVGVVVVEFLVGMPDARQCEPLGQDARAVLNVILVAPAAIDVDAGKRLEVVPVFRHQIDRIMRAPLCPALRDDFA